MKKTEVVAREGARNDAPFLTTTSPSFESTAALRAGLSMSGSGGGGRK